MKVLTSQDSAIRVDWLPQEWPGKVGLTFAPGKKAMSKWNPINWDRDLDMDLDHLTSKERVDVLVCLLQDHELLELKIPNLIEAAKARGLDVIRLPIPDGGVLPSVEPVRTLVAQIRSLAQAGKRIALHCAGGLGRTGTVAGCLLVADGMSPQAAIDLLHATRDKRCPENPGQEQFIRSFRA